MPVRLDTRPSGVSQQRPSSSVPWRCTWRSSSTAAAIHKRFGFRPFNESDVWTVEIVRLHADGTQWSVNDGTWEYNWDEVVGATKMQRLTSLRDAPHPPVHAPRSTFSGDRLIG